MTIEIKDTNKIIEIKGGHAGIIPAMFVKILKLEYKQRLEVTLTENNELHITPIQKTDYTKDEAFKISKAMSVRKIGGSLMIGIPKAFFEVLELKLHDTIEWELTFDGTIIMRFNV